MSTPTPPPGGIARHTVRGSAYSVTASAITIGLGLLRTYLMVTLLLPDEIGLAALGLFYVNLANQFGTFGLGSAYIHKPEAGEADLRTYYSMHLLFAGGALLLATAAAPWIESFYPAFENLHWIIWAYAVFAMVRAVSQPQVAVLERNLVFGRIALLDVFGALAKTVVGPGMAFTGFGVWAVLGEFAAGETIRFLMLHLWIRPFRPRPGWSRKAAAWFWKYGKSIWMSSNLTFLIDSFDDFWVGTALGKSPLGLYSKAYEFSRYPRRVIGNPILSVFFPTYARLQADRDRLSRAFFRATSLIVRAGGLFALVLLLTAPEFFRLFLPEAWWPMRPTFQLMVIYTFLDPLAMSAQRLLVATGLASRVTRVRWVQTLVFIPAVILGAAFAGINGVAIAANIMILFGAVLLFRNTLEVVDYSMTGLLRWPLLSALGIGILGLLAAPGIAHLSDAWVLAVKLVLVPPLYTVLLYVFEREQLLKGVQMLHGLLSRRAE